MHILKKHISDLKLYQLPIITEKSKTGKRLLLKLKKPIIDFVIFS